ncbi:MAG: hypothetical protein LBT23_05580 [Synergistaceae bacterium]|nr:hypothetical protein [Synergistaceae bacterium]
MIRTALAVVITALVVLSAPRYAIAADEPEDWYTWYEKQNKAAAAQNAADYDQNYDATSPDIYTDPNYPDDPYVDGQYTQDGQNVQDDPNDQNGQGDQTTQDDPNAQGAPDTDEPAWIWAQGESPPDQTQQDEQPK